MLAVNITPKDESGIDRTKDVIITYYLSADASSPIDAAWYEKPFTFKTSDTIVYRALLSAYVPITKTVYVTATYEYYKTGTTSPTVELTDTKTITVTEETPTVNIGIEEALPLRPIIDVKKVSDDLVIKTFDLDRIDFQRTETEFTVLDVDGYMIGSQKSDRDDADTDLTYTLDVSSVPEASYPLTIYAVQRSGADETLVGKNIFNFEDKHKYAYINIPPANRAWDRKILFTNKVYQVDIYQNGDRVFSQSYGSSGTNSITLSAGIECGMCTIAVYDNANKRYEQDLFLPGFKQITTT